MNTDAVWQPPLASVQGIKSKCASMAGAAPECFVTSMGKADASPAAVAFARSTGNDAYLREFRHVGPVDIAHLSYSFRANENDAVWVVNGSPARVDVDDQNLLAKGQLEQDTSYRALAKTYPEISLWPEDRFETKSILVRQLPGKRVRFVVPYRLRNQCHACAVVGTVEFGFDFDEHGVFLGTKLIRVAGSR